MEDLKIINRKLDGNLHTCIKSYQFPTPIHRLFLHRWAYPQNMMEIFVESTISRIQKVHLLLAAYLYWVLCHYLNDFIAILSDNITTGRIQLESNSYNWLPDLLVIPWNDSKDWE